ncbi:MAG: hypothetical protein AAFV38_10460 [Pseudomonadota bacterium]
MRKERVLTVGRAIGLSRFLCASPELSARGRAPLIDPAPEALSALARSGLRLLTDHGPLLRSTGSAGFALLEGWMARPTLQAIERSPDLVASGGLTFSPFRTRWRLMRLAVLKR